MKTLVSVLILFSGLAEAGCRFTSSQKIYSLSGPFTSVLEESGLISAPELAGIWIFYPKMKSFQGKYIPGGIFLSPSQLQQMKGSKIFFDEGQELRKLFRKQRLEAVEISSRGLTPREVMEKVIEVAKPLTVGCDFQKVLARLLHSEQKIMQAMKKKESIIFFLGKVDGGKLPEMVMAHDGLVLWLKKMRLIESYPSELAYVNWSGSLINDLESRSQFIGLRETELPEVTGTKRRATLSYPGALIPGIRQLDAWNYFLDHRPL